MIKKKKNVLFMITLFKIYDEFSVGLKILIYSYTSQIQKNSHLLLMKLIASYAELTFTMGMMGPKISSVITCNKNMTTYQIH